MRSLIAVAVLLAASSAALPSAAGKDAARQAKLVYDVYAGGLHALNLGLALQVDGQRYRVEGDLRTVGAVDVMVRWRSAQETRGLLLNGKALPEAHERSGEWRLNKRSTRMTYDSAGGVEVATVPAPKEDERPPVPAYLRRGTLDIMSAMLQASLAASPAAACQGVAQIFDGRRRYDMVFAAAGEDTLKPTKYGLFSGAALRCRIELNPIAGFRPEDEGETGLGFPEGVVVWLARNEACGLVLPVRVRATTEFGDVVVHLSRVGGNDQRHAQRLN